MLIDRDEYILAIENARLLNNLTVLSTVSVRQLLITLSQFKGLKLASSKLFCINIHQNFCYLKKNIYKKRVWI